MKHFPSCVISNFAGLLISSKTAMSGQGAKMTRWRHRKLTEKVWFYIICHLLCLWILKHNLSDMSWIQHQVETVSSSTGDEQQLFDKNGFAVASWAIMCTRRRLLQRQFQLLWLQWGIIDQLEIISSWSSLVHMPCSRFSSHQLSILSRYFISHCPSEACAA